MLKILMISVLAKLDESLKHVGTILGLEGIELNEKGQCVLSFDEKIVVQFQAKEEKEQAVLMSFIGTVKGDLEKGYGTLLEGNFLWRETGGATLALEEKEELPQVVLVEKLSLPLLNNETFEKILERFVNCAELWIDKLNTPFVADSQNVTTAEADKNLEAFALKI